MCLSRRWVLTLLSLVTMLGLSAGCSEKAAGTSATSAVGASERAPVSDEQPHAGALAARVPPENAERSSEDLGIQDVALSSDDDDWTSFRNSPRQLGLAGSALPETLELLWEYPTAEGVKSTAAIAGGSVYIGTVEGHLLCLSLRTGELVWKYRSIDSENPQDFAPSFNAPVTLTSDLVLAGDQDGTLHAVERTSGQRRWVFATGGEIVGGATVIGERVIFGSHADRLFCLNLADGMKIWEFETLGPVNGSQAIADGRTFVVGCSEPILRVVDLETGEQEGELPIEGLLIATPALVDDILYFGTNEGGVFAVDWQQQTQVWDYSDPDRAFEIHSSPAVLDDLVVIGSRDKRLHCIDRTSGERVWTFPTRAGIDSSPVIVGDRVFFGSGDKNVYGLRLIDGKEVWRYAAGQEITGSPAVGEGCLVIGTDQTEGRVLCFGESTPADGNPAGAGE